MSFEELQRMLEEEWGRLPEELKTPYRDRANERRLRRETMGAAIALTQIGTPSFRPGDPATPVPKKEKARRCLDIGAPGWQSPTASGNSSFGCDDSNIADDAGSADRAGLLDRGAGAASTLPSFPSSPASPPASSASAPPPAWGPTPPASSFPPARGAGGGVIRRRGGDVLFASPTVAAAAAATAASMTPGSGSIHDGDGGGPDPRVGLEVRAAVVATSKNGGSSSVTAATTTTTSRSRGGSSKSTTAPSGGRKRKPSSSASTSTSSKRAKSSSAAKPSAAAKKIRSKERARKAEYKAGREIVAKMSKKDPARPKGPQSSYILFYTDKVASVQAARPDMSITDVGTAVGEAWRGLSDEKRNPYTKRAEADRKRYEGQLRAIAQKAAAAATAAAPAR